MVYEKAAKKRKMVYEDAEAAKKQRLIWSKELHDKFLNAVSKLPDNQVNPTKIMEHLNAPGITRVQVASHLQKYRIKKKLQEIVLPTTVIPTPVHPTTVLPPCFQPPFHLTENVFINPNMEVDYWLDQDPHHIPLPPNPTMDCYNLQEWDQEPMPLIEPQGTEATLYRDVISRMHIVADEMRAMLGPSRATTVPIEWIERWLHMITSEAAPVTPSFGPRHEFQNFQYEVGQRSGHS